MNFVAQSTKSSHVRDLIILHMGIMEYSNSDVSAIMSISVSTFHRKIKILCNDLIIDGQFVLLLCYTLGIEVQELAQAAFKDLSKEQLVELAKVSLAIDQLNSVLKAKSDKRRSAFHFKVLPKGCLSIPVDRLN